MVSGAVIFHWKNIHANQQVKTKRLISRARLFHKVTNVYCMLYVSLCVLYIFLLCLAVTPDSFSLIPCIIFEKSVSFLKFFKYISYMSSFVPLCSLLSRDVWLYGASLSWISPVSLPTIFPVKSKLMTLQGEYSSHTTWQKTIRFDSL